MNLSQDTLGDLFVEHMHLGDHRRDRRFAFMLEQLVTRPDGCVTAVFRKPKEQLAAYRFLESDYFDHRDISLGIARTTAAKINDYKYQSIVIALDKAAIPLPATPFELNDLTYKGYNPGYWSLNAIALESHDHLPIGLLSQILYEKPEIPLSKRMTQLERQSRPWHEKESYLWKVAIEECLEVLRESCEHMPHVRFVIDAEGDIARLLQWVDAQPDCELCVRMATKTRKEIFHQEQIAHVLRQERIEATYEMYRPRQKRHAKIGVGFAPISYDVFKRMPTDWRKRQGTLNIWGGVAHEIDPPDDVQPVEWLLVTTEPVETIDQALELVRHYNGRWIIERFHHGLKQVLNISKTQLGSSDTLKKWIHIQSQAAMEIERLMRMSRSAPQTKAVDEVGRTAVYVVMAMQYQAPQPFEERALEDVTLEEFVLWLAQLGGYRKRKRGKPGHTTISRGWISISATVSAMKRGALPSPKQL